jgi:hypothetical protein
MAVKMLMTNRKIVTPMNGEIAMMNLRHFEFMSHLTESF